MRDLAIAYGNNRQAKKWVNKTIRFDDLKERLKVTIRTTESAEEYAKMSKAQRDAAKDHGGFVAGVLIGGRRKVETVEKRSMIALDGDRITKEFLANYETVCPYTSVLYTTHSHTDENPRARLVFPLTRDLSPEEFVAVSRYLAQMLGIDFFDECSYQPNQLMYWPSSPQNGVFVYKETDGGWLDPDDILSAHPEWTDPTRLPTSSRESKANTTAQQKVQDPLTKDGTVGLFNRVFFPVSRALETFLSDVYEPTDNENRWHLIESHSMAGVEIKDDKFVYSHHAKDPTYLKLCNAFDIVRIHKFGDLDDKASFRAMCDFAMQQDEVKVAAANEREMCKNYLSGMSFKNAAAAVGLNMSHCGVKRMMLNARYLGDEFYPAILTEETVRQVEAERIRREKALGRDRRKGKGAPKGICYTGFSAPMIAMKYKDPVKQAEYAYSRIRNEVSG